jgi:hypothetical protein
MFMDCVETTGADEELTRLLRAQICVRDVFLKKRNQRILVTMDRHLLNAVHRLNSPSGQSMVD